MSVASGAAASTSDADRDFRAAVLGFGFAVGWLSLAVVVVGLFFDVTHRHRVLLFGLTAAAAAGNAVAMRVPWRRWLPLRRGLVLLDVWTGAIIGFIVVLVAAGGPNFTLLLFLALPFIAVAHVGWRRAFWLGGSLVTCSVAGLLIPLPLSTTAMRLLIVAATVAVALVVARVIRNEAAARRRASERAELEHALAAESDHRIKNSLQTTADLLLLARPEGGDAVAFDETAGRIRAIATVHRLLTEHAAAPVAARSLLEAIVADAHGRVSVDADTVALPPNAAQSFGIVANELIANALRHGEPPVTVRLTHDGDLRLRVDDAGCLGGAAESGFGLWLVRRVVEHGLGGTFELLARDGGTRAEVVIPAGAK